MSTFEDCQKFLSFVAECFVEKPVTVDHKKLEKLKTTTATSPGSNEDPPTKISNGEIYKGDEKEPTEPSLKGFGHRDSESHGEAYTLTGIYIYPIKSCGAHEVWAKHHPVCFSFLLFLSLSLLISFPLSVLTVLFFMQVHDWPLGPQGLLYDRGWMVVNANGVCLSQKRETRLCLIHPQVHMPSNKLLLQASGQTVSHWK